MAWLRTIQSESNNKKPSSEQIRCIEAIMERCAQEARDENLDNEYRSEPLRLILHGVPGVSVFPPKKK